MSCRHVRPLERTFGSARSRERSVLSNVQVVSCRHVRSLARTVGSRELTGRVVSARPFARENEHSGRFVRKNIRFSRTYSSCRVGTSVRSREQSVLASVQLVSFRHVRSLESSFGSVRSREYSILSSVQVASCCQIGSLEKQSVFSRGPWKVKLHMHVKLLQNTNAKANMRSAVDVINNLSFRSINMTMFFETNKMSYIIGHWHFPSFFFFCRNSQQY